MDIREQFGEHGVRCMIGEHEFNRRSARIKAVLFDWDGVFNDGFKDAQGGSPFSEVDSMGVNLLRFALWERNQGTMPLSAIITGQHNPMAEAFAQRERFHAVYMGYTNKPEAFDAFLDAHGLEPAEVLFFFDDVLDLPVAARCGLRVLIGHRATHHFQRSVEHLALADVVMPMGGGHHGLREACEFLMAFWGQWDAVLDQRVRYSDAYRAYLGRRSEVRTVVHTLQR